MWRSDFVKLLNPPMLDWLRCHGWAPPQEYDRKHAGVRIWRIREFEEYLIAYQPRRGGVAIERLIHAKQDYRRILK